MAQAARATSTQAIHSEVLHIVLFGMPAAGKTSLLGVLEQAAETQVHLLNGRLSETAGGLRHEPRRREGHEGERRRKKVRSSLPLFAPFAPSRFNLTTGTAA